MSTLVDAVSRARSLASSTSPADHERALRLLAGAGYRSDGALTSAGVDTTDPVELARVVDQRLEAGRERREPLVCVGASPQEAADRLMAAATSLARAVRAGDVSEVDAAMASGACVRSLEAGLGLSPRWRVTTGASH